MNKLLLVSFVFLLNGCSLPLKVEPSINELVVTRIINKFSNHEAFCGEPIRHITYCPDNNKSKTSVECYRAYSQVVSTTSPEAVFIEIKVISGQYLASDKKFQMHSGVVLDVISGCVR